MVYLLICSSVGGIMSALQWLYTAAIIVTGVCGVMGFLGVADYLLVRRDVTTRREFLIFLCFLVVGMPAAVVFGVLFHHTA